MNLISVDSAVKTATDGVLTLTITADLDDGVGEQSLPYGWMVGDPNGLGPQVDAYMDAHPEIAENASDAPAAPLPNLLPYQFRAMLVLSGNEAALDAYVGGLTDPAKTIAQAKLDYSLVFERQNSLVLAAQAALGLSDAQMDALWAQAAAIT